MVVLLHGLTMNRASYSDVVPWLVDRGQRVVNVDLRGHGESPWAASYRAIDYVSDLVDLIERERLGPAVLVGHSVGGIAAATLTARHPELVRALLMEDPPFYQGDEEIRAATPLMEIFPMFADEIRAWQKSGVTLTQLAEEVAAWPSPYPEWSQLEFLGPDGVRERARAILSCDPGALLAGCNGELWEGLDPASPLERPVTLLAADPELDGTFFAEHADRFRATVPRARVVSLPGCSHVIHVQKSGLSAYLRELGRLLDSL